MRFTSRHARELAEIKAIHAEIADRVRESLEQIEQIKRVQSEPRARDRRRAGSEVDEHILAFVRIPKTAGATVTSMLAAAYSREGLHNAGNFFKDPQGTARKVTRRAGGWERWHRNGGRVTIGHVPYGLFREHLPGGTRYMTLLREPVDRVLSHYHRHIRRTGTYRDQRRPVTTDSLEEALEMGLPDVNDLATRLLCGHPSPLGELPASAVDDAKANLREFAFVGIQERFEESVVLLQRTLGLGLVPYVNVNVNLDRPGVEEISDGQRALIAEHNRRDTELHSFAKGLFEYAVAVADDGFAADVRRLRALSAEANDEAIQLARDWLERELPTGTARPLASLWSASEAAGVAPGALKYVSTLMSVNVELGDDGQVTWARSEDSHEPVEPNS